jgi:hypothetical protein
MDNNLLGLPCVDYYHYLVDRHKQCQNEATLKDLEDHKSDCQRSMFRVGDIWQAPRFSKWKVTEVTVDGIATFVDIKKDITFAMKWDSLSLNSWKLLSREPTP